MKANLCIVILFSFFSCRNAQPSGHQVVGKWKMSAVFESGADVSARHNPAGNRYIEFLADGTFRSDGDPFGTNTGKWSFDSGKGILIIDSDVDDDDSEWRVSFGDNNMEWTGIGHPRKESTRIVHVRME